MSPEVGVAMKTKGEQTSGLLRSLPRLAEDKLRMRRRPADIEREFIANGIDPAEARTAINRAIESRYATERSRARAEMLTGIVLFVISLGLSVGTMIMASSGGGLIVLFYGGVLVGIAAFFRGLALRPVPPVLLGAEPAPAKRGPRWKSEPGGF
jgi:hypothetical protein